MLWISRDARLEFPGPRPATKSHGDMPLILCLILPILQNQHQTSPKLGDNVAQRLRCTTVLLGAEDWPLRPTWSLRTAPGGSTFKRPWTGFFMHLGGSRASLGGW